ncbi:MAG: type II secretion system F family protein [Desulfobacteraceae bacterium]|nr:type II secretion system F family protein [Desulfobacteraceae bacterium]
MNYFRYKLITASGEVSSGVVKLPYQETMSAINHLERDGSMTLYVAKLGNFAKWLIKIFELRPKQRLPRIVLAEILNNLALMLRAGMPLIAAMEEIVETADYPSIKKDFAEIVKRIQDGSGFTEAAELYPHIFPKNILFLARMGEETGKLDEMLKDASEHLRRIHKIISDTKQALLYPGFVITAISGGMLFWFAFVVPKIVSLFKEMDVTLPAITLYLIAVSEFAQKYYLCVIVGIFCLVAATLVLRKKNRSFRKAMDNVMLHLPVLKSIINASSLAYISEYFSMLINAGIDIMQSVKILNESVGNEVYKDKLKQVRGCLENGEGISDSFKSVSIFPGFVVRMMSVGENSGTLPEQLNYISEQYREKLSVIVSTIGKAIEPLVLIVAGAIFAIIVIGLFLPIYDLISGVSA